MKKLMRMMAMALMAVAMTVGFAACSSSDDDNNGGGGTTPEKPKITAGKAVFDITFPGDLLAVADVTFIYTDADGREKTENVTSTNFKKEVVYTKLPVNVSYTCKATLKSNYTPKDKYNFPLSGEISYGIITSDGKFTSTSKAGVVPGINGVKGENLEKYLKQFSSLIKGSFTIDK